MSSVEVLKDRGLLLRVLEQLAGRFRYEWPSGSFTAFCDAINKIKRDKDGDYLSYSQDDPSRVSYAQKKEQQFDYTKRTKTTLGRYFRRKLKVSKKVMSDSQLHQITRAVFAARAPLEDLIAVVRGDAIVDAYENHVGAGTCMTGEKSGFTKLYAENPDIIAMAIYGGSEARALLWITVNGDQVLDRIYPNSGQHIEAYWRWAQEKGIIYRCHNSFPEGFVELSDGNKHVVHIVGAERKRTYPYLDTFTYGEFRRSDGVLELSNDPGHGRLCFTSPSGGYRGACNFCENGRSRYEIHGREYCTECGEIYLFNCEHCGNREVNEHAVYVREVIYAVGRSFRDRMEREREWCEACAMHEAPRCAECNQGFAGDWLVMDRRGQWTCRDCLRSRNEVIGNRCSHCNRPFIRIRPPADDDQSLWNVCANCITRCVTCGRQIRNFGMGSDRCRSCQTAAIQRRQRAAGQGQTTAGMVDVDGGAEIPIAVYLNMMNPPPSNSAGVGERFEPLRRRRAPRRRPEDVEEAQAEPQDGVMAQNGEVTFQINYNDPFVNVPPLTALRPNVVIQEDPGPPRPIWPVWDPEPDENRNADGQCDCPECREERGETISEDE